MWNANHIYIGYCTSDSYTGYKQAQAQSMGHDQADSSGSNPNGNMNNRRNRHHQRNIDNQYQHQRNNFRSNNNNNHQQQPLSFAFMGSKVVERVVESLFENLAPDASLYEAQSILFAGESAGAAGVLLNLDKIRDFIRNKFAIRHELQQLIAAANSDQLSVNQASQIFAPKPMPIVRGLADSGWFVDNELHEFDSQQQQQMRTSTENNNNNNNNNNQDYLAPEWDCEQQMCSPRQTIRQAMAFWRGQVPQACSQRYSNEPWLCYFAYRTYQSLETPLFVVQWLYDDYQLMSDKLIPANLMSQSQESNDLYWQNIRKVGQQVRRSLENVTALFAPSCLSHSMITHSSWNQIYVNGFRLPHVLNRWEEQSLIDKQTTTTSTADSPAQNNQSNGKLNSNSKQQISNQNRANANNNRNNYHYNNEDSSQQRAALSLHNKQEINGPPSSNNQQHQNGRPKGNVKKKRRNNQVRSRVLTRNSIHEMQNSQAIVQTEQNQNNYQQSNNNYFYQAASQPSQLMTSFENNQQQATSSNFIQDPRLTSPTTESIVSGPASAPTSSMGTIITDSNQEDLSSYQASPSSAHLVDQPASPVSPNGWYLVNANLEPTNNPSLRLMLLNQPNSSYLQRAKSAVENKANRFRLIDSCGWPQCNRDCPILNPYLHSRAISN